MFDYRDWTDMNSLLALQGDTAPVNFLSRQKRDALRIHAEQIMAVLVLEGERTKASVLWLLNELRSAAEQLASDYAENADRAYKEKEYKRWLRIAAISTTSLQELAHHNMGSAKGVGLLVDMTNLSYVLGMNVVNVFNQLSSVLPSLSTLLLNGHSLISTIATSLQSVQPYFAIGLFGFWALFEIIAVFKHYVQSSQRGKEENPRAKFLEGGRWLRLVNGGIWIAAGMTSVILGIVFSSGAAIPVLALMAATVLVSGIVRSIHQAVELTKLTVVLKDYEKQLCDETTAPEKREALESLATQLRGSIRQGRAKLVSSIALTLASVAGIVVTVLAVALTLTPLFFVGAGILLIAGIVTIALNRQAIQGAFKAIGSRLKKKTMASEPPSERPMPTKPSPMLQRFVESDPNETHEAMEALAGHRSCADLHNELNASWEALAHEAEGKTPVSDLRGWRGQQELNQQTRQSLSSLARAHRPPSGNAEDVVRASREKSEQKQQEALMEKKAAEKTQRDEN